MRPKSFNIPELEESWAESKVLTGHGKEVYDLSWSSDEKTVVTASLDHSLIVWEATTGKLIQKLDGHNNYVKGVALDPLGGHVVSVSNDRSIRIYK